MGKLEFLTERLTATYDLMALILRVAGQRLGKMGKIK
jgi:hypothetical protein